MAEIDAQFEQMASRHHFSADAVATLARAIRAGGGTAAQFSHVEFGGMGQWSRGGMIMISDMFNDTLKQRIARLCDDLARDMEHAPLAAAEQAGTPAASPGSGGWWPDELGRPTSTGAQNDMRYAFFPDACRLAIQRDGTTEIYDTGEHRLSGFSQAQSTGQTIAFSSQHGAVSLPSLRKLDDQPSRASVPGHAAAPEPTTLNPFTGLERLADLHRKGVVTPDEFAAKKQELLARI